MALSGKVCNGTCQTVARSPFSSGSVKRLSWKLGIVFYAKNALGNTEIKYLRRKNEVLLQTVVSVELSRTFAESMNCILLNDVCNTRCLSSTFLKDFSGILNFISHRKVLSTHMGKSCLVLVNQGVNFYCKCYHVYFLSTSPKLCNCFQCCDYPLLGGKQNYMSMYPKQTWKRILKLWFIFSLQGRKAISAANQFHSFAEKG